MRRVSAAWLSIALACVACGEKTRTPPGEPPPDTSIGFEDDPSVRPAFRAGSDYPGERLELDERVWELLAEAGEHEKKPAFAILTPHAGFVYSGHVAATAYARVQVPDTIILVTPKHHGEGESPALWNEGPFIIPGHAVQVRNDLVERFAELAPDGEAKLDRAAFMESANHPLENQLPFITTLNPEAKIVPFAIYDNSGRHFSDWDNERVEAWGRALADLVTEIEAAGDDVLVVATTDLVHRIPLTDAEEQDAQLLEHFVARNVNAVHEYVVAGSITICGEMPTAITMSAANHLGYTNTELVLHDTSFHRQQDPDSVVGYPSVIFWPESK